MNNTHIIYPIGAKAICPACSGLMCRVFDKKSLTHRYECADCCSTFAVMGEGPNDKCIACKKE